MFCLATLAVQMRCAVDSQEEHRALDKEVHFHALNYTAMYSAADMTAILGS
jgi:hypothetical protein